MFRFRRVVLTVLIAASLACLGPSLARAAVKVGDSPNFHFRSVGGMKVSSKLLKGRLVVLDFWATWCGPCMHEMPHMIKLHKKYASKGVQIIGISLDSNEAALKRVVKEKGMRWPQYFDGKGWDNAFAVRFGVHSIPRTFLISPTGKVLWSGHPGRLDKPLHKALKDHPPTVDSEAKAQGDSADDAANASKASDSSTSAGKADATDRAKAKADVSDSAGTNGDDAQAKADTGRDFSSKSLESISKPGTSADGSAKATLAKRKLAKAESLREAEHHYRAYKAYQWVVKHGAGTASAQSASKRLDAYQANDKLMAKIKAEQNEHEARRLLSMGKNYQNANRPELARKNYKKLLADYPKTKAAAEAQTQLANLQ